VRSRRARRVYYTTNLEYETEIEGGGVRLSLFVRRENGVRIKGQAILKVVVKGAAGSLHRRGHVRKRRILYIV